MKNATVLSTWFRSGQILLSPLIPFLQNSSNCKGNSVWALEGLVPILSQVEIPVAIGETLFQKLKALTESSTPAFGPIGGLIRVIPHRADELASWLRTGLASSSRDMATGALSGIGFLDACVKQLRRIGPKSA